MNIEQVLRSKNIKTQHEWQWQVALYLYLAGIGAGSIAISILMDWLGYIPDGLKPLILWGPILVAIGALFLVLKLGVKIRFLNTVINPMSSWLSRGFYILSMCIISGMLLFLLSLLPYFASWLDFSFTVWPWLLNALDIVGFIFALGTAVYTGILIMSVKYVPYWKTLLLPVLFTISAISTGVMAITLVTTGWNLFTGTTAFTTFSAFMADANILVTAEVFPEGFENLMATIEQVLLALETITIGAFLFTQYRANEYGRYSVQLLLSGRYKFLFWGGLVLCGLILPAILEIIYGMHHSWYIMVFITGASVLIAGFFVRYTIVYAGIKEDPPMLRTVSKRVRLNRESSVREQNR